MAFFFHKFLGYSQHIFHQVKWLCLAILAASLLSRILLYIVQRSPLTRLYLPKSIKLQQHYAGSVYSLFLVILLKWCTLDSFSQHTSLHTHKLLSSALVATLAWTIVKTLSLLRIVIYSKLQVSTVDNLRERKIKTQVQYVEKVILIFICVVTIALIMMNFDSARKIGSSLIASAGLAGVLIGFAAQRSLANLLAGFQIAFTQPIRMDDVVIIEGEWGRIEEITLTYVVVRIWDKRTLIVPITYFIEKPFQNWTRASSDLLGVVFLHLDYRMPVEPLRAEFDRLLQSNDLWDKSASALQVTDFTETTMELRLIMGARNAGDAFNLRCFVRERLITFIQTHHPEYLPQHRVQSKAT